MTPSLQVRLRYEARSAFTDGVQVFAMFRTASAAHRYRLRHLPGGHIFDTYTGECFGA